MHDAGRDNVVVAIVGMACRLPGARNLDEFWRLVVSGGDATGSLPDDVFDRDLYYDPRRGVRGKSYSAVGGLVPRVPFDNDKCRLDPDKLKNYDPAHLIACEVAHDALRDAGYDPHAMPSLRSGTYFGHTGGTTKAGDIVYSSYIEQSASLLREVAALEGLPREEIDRIAAEIIQEVRERCDHRVSSPDFDGSPNNLARTIASAFHLDGPCIVVDAACASSLQALALGARALQLGEADMVVTGGASCCKSDSLVLFSAAQSISDGKSCPFDEKASGLVTAEGYIALVMKTLPRALADGDRIRCLVRGIGVAADGRGKSLWAPRKEGQVIAMERAYPEGIKPEHVQYVEAHATSTQVGDATELAALAEAFSDRAANTKVPLGSVKANIGHTLETAGVAGLVKAALAMEKETIPPVANLTQPNSTVAWDEMPFYLPLRTERWESPGDGTPRRAAVNSFGIGGLNVHVLLEEYTPRVAERSSGGPATAPSSEPGEPIAIVGMGTMLPGARNVDEYWQLLESGRDVKTQAPEDRWDATRWVDPSGRDPYRPLHGRGGFLTDYKYDWRRHRVPPKQVANANPLQFMLLDATEQALEQAGYLKKEFDHRRVGVIVGTIFGGDFPNQLQVGLRLPEFGRSLRRYLSERGLQGSQIDKAVAEYEDVLLNKMPALLDETGSFTSSTLASRITKTFDLKGGALAMDAGDGSGLAPLGASMDVLRTGECDMMICATGQRNMDSFAFESLSRSGRLGDEKGEHPFDAGGDGFLPAEGCAVLLLKRLSDARRDGDQILAVLSGMGSGPHAPRQGAEEQSAIEQALAATAIGPADVQFVETTALGKDEARRELQEIQHALAVEPRHRPVQVNTLIRQFGYFGAAHAIAGILKGILAIAHGRYPGGPVASSPDPQLPFSEAVQPQRTCVSLPEGEDTVIGISARGPSGPTYATFVESVSRAVARRARRTAPAEKPTATPVASHHIIRIGARDWQTLYNQLQNGSVDQLYDPHYRFSGSDRSRLAIVCRDQADFTEKLAEAIARLPRPNVLAREQLAAHGIYFGAPSPVAGGVGFLFPGQGSQYAGMLGSLIDELPAADVARRRADAAMKALNYSDFRTIAGPNATDLGSDIWKTQVSMLLGNCILEETLRQLGLAPTVVAGHSFGEYAALVCAGVWSLTDAIRATRHRYESIEGSAAGSGRMAATNAPLEEVQSILATVGGDVFVANRNAPDQTVISGHQAPVQEAIARLKKRGHTAMLIKVPCPFHTPLMASTADALAERLQDVSLRDPRVPVISTATATKMLSAEEVRQSLKNQLVEPVKYGEILEEVLAMRPALVVEVGPRQTLTQLNKKNHPQDDVLFLASDVLRRPGAMTLLGVLAQAECLGCQEIEARRKQGAAKRAEDQAGRLLVFDATERRTTKMRARAKSGASSTPAGGASRPTGGSAASPGGNGSQRRPQPVDATAERSARQHGTGTASKTNAATPQPSPQASVRSEAPQPQMATASKPVGASEAQPNRVSQLASAPSRESTPASRQDLQRILVGFVIDQTGYPEEIIELDADLEADLGIDSIKKAQLFGEVGERFQIAPREDLSLDDFPTLNHVLDFLVQELGAVDGGAAVGETEAVGAKAPEKTVADEASAHANPASAAPGTEESAGGDAPAAVAGGPGREELRDILVGFVIDQTGYPEEIIELDADLEADLGIDSIKKAQLFGEVGERFQIAPREDLSLDDFPTLNHVLDFLVQELGAVDGGAAMGETETVGAKAPEKTVADDAPAHANPASAAPGTEESAGDDAAAAGGPGREELRDILVGFVIDQTGYPEEIIELDADLEADLGIDSIKKAQLFGEVGERFQIAPREDLSLDDFPTLNHVLDFLVQELGAAENDSARAVETVEDEPQSVETVGDERQAGGVDDRVEAASVADSTSTLDSAAEAASRDASVVRLESVQVRVLTGTPRELGRCHGSTLQETIRRELYSMVDVNGPRISGDAASKWPEPWQEELTALAQAVEVNRAAVTNWNQQADPLSALPTSFATTSVQPLRPSQRGATVLMQVRKPNSGLEYLTFGRPGKLFAPFGINGARVAVSCEPLDETVSAEDVIGVACWMHQELGESRAIADAAPRLRQLSLQGRWSIGMHVPGSGASRFWLCESGRVRSEETGATPEQNHVHSMLEKDSDTIVLVDRRTGLTEQVMLDDWLRPVTARATVEPEAEPDALADASMKRHVLRMTGVERPRPATPVYRAGAHVAVLGDSEVAEPLCSQLGALGCRVIHVGDQDLATAFESSRAGDLPGHVILASESSTEHPALEAFQAARHFESLFHACRRWIAALEQADAMAGASLVGVTRMGGDFGFHSSVAGFAGGGITGLLKGIRREYPAIRVKAIDFDDGAWPETVAAEVTGEVNSESTELEIGFRSGQRYLVQAVATPGPSEREELSRSGVWVVSGGGRGVTFAVVRELARRHDLKLHLLGRAPVPEGGAWRGKSEQDLRELKQQTAIQARREGRNPGDAWRQIEKEMELDRNLASVREEGLQVTYHCCDVGDRTQLAAVLQRIRQREGTIDGILHGAGVEAAARFTRKKDPLVRATIASKCDGLSNLIALTREDPLKWFLGFGSTSGRFGGLGQADYSLASDLMAKMMDRLAYERPECRAVGFHWPAWDEVGMAVRPESRMALEHGGINFMPVAEGVAHVIAEISGPRREREILILDKPDVLDTDGTMTRDAEPCEPGVFQTEQAGDVSPSRASGRAAPAAVTGGAGKSDEIDVSRVPLIDSIRSGDEPGSYEALVTLDPRHDPFLVHHRFRDQPFLPAVISMELFAEAACLTRPGARFQSIRDLRIDEGWSLPATGKAQEARVLLRPTAEGVRCELRGARCDSNGKVLDGNRLFVSGVVELGSEPARIEPIDPGQPVLAWTPFVYPEGTQIVHGPLLQAFKKLDFVHGGGRAILSCGPTGELFGDRPGDAVQVASALLDGCLVACGAYSYFMVNQKIEMPKGMESYRQARLPRPEEICTLRFFLGETMSEGHVYDFTLMGDQGDAILQVEGYQSFQLGNMI